MKLWLAAVALFAGVFIVHSASPMSTSADSRWTVPVALSLWDRGDLDLNEYPAQMQMHNYYGVECVQRGVSVALSEHAAGCRFRYYPHYPVGGPVLASPLIIALRAIRLPIGSTGRPALDAVLAGNLVEAHATVEVIVASAFVAATAALLFLIAARFLPIGHATGLALIFAFSTPAWSTASRALWQHTPSMLLIAATVYFLIQAERRPWHAALAGLPVALSYAVRPMNALFVLVITAYVFMQHRRQFAIYIAFAAPIAAAFFTYNWSVYAALFSPYYSQRPPAFNIGAFLAAAAANLISPSRGLFVFLPVALLCVYGAWKFDTRLARYLAVWVVLHWLAISSFVSFWWAGHSYGPRFFTDTIPVLMLFLIPVLKPPRTLLMTAALIVTVSFGAWVHSRGAWRFAGHEWNTTPVNVDQNPQRVWDWSDPQFFR